ncbi:uncharacterized protein LOC101093758 isoform X6 [Felis catus]|uniref:uncharacterized protein LOC101093758 isoform X6 n=1 Tax=Felis catus TaxID=9685 RepID=UPI001D1A08A4|nr:uncharacterized protein LOC101093758 isoform X6 [Felis catus]
MSGIKTFDDATTGKEEGTAKSAMEAKEDGVGVIENVPPEQTVNGSLTSAGGVHKNYRSDMMSASELGEEDDVESPSLPEGRCSSSVLTTLQITESGPPRLSRIIFLPENQRVMDFNHIYKTPSKQHLDFIFKQCLYPRWAQTYSPEIKSHMLHRLNQPDAPLLFFLISDYLQNNNNNNNQQSA